MMTFLQINLLLVISYLLFVGVQKIERLLKWTSSHKVFLRCAQFLVILSLSAPLVMKLVPVKKLPAYQSHFPVLNEYDGSNFRKATNKIDSFVKSAPAIVEIDQKSMNIDYRMIILALYILGSTFFLVKFANNYLKLKKLLENATVFKQTKKLKIVVSDQVSVPFSVKMLWSYWVVIPVDLLSSKKDLSFAIKHELQHHRQGDTVWAVFIELLSCVLFFNPMIYLWKNTIIEFQEFSCDESLTGQEDVLSHDYGSCLLRVAETALTNRQMYAGTTSMAVVFKNSKYFKTFLLRRIEMIVGEKKSTSKWVPICTGFVIALCTITFSYGVERVMMNKTRAVNLGKLIVDEDIQKIANDSLEKALKDPQFTAGFVIVSNPNTGKIIAVANIDKKNRLKNHWALSQLFEPASIGKTFIIAEALDKNLTTPETQFKCENGKYKYKGRVYYDWKEEGFNELTTTQTLASSSNICSMKIAEIVGDAGLKAMTDKFGFGTGDLAKDFPEASSGDKAEVTEDFIPRVSFGYAFRNSPLEIMQAFSAVINGGNLMKPIMGDEKSEVVRRVISEESSRKMKAILSEVVLSGTAKNTGLSSFYTTAGKTASSSLGFFANEKFKGNERPNFAAFVGFAPVKAPQVQVFVGMIKEASNRSGAHGGAHAAPVFKEVTENVLAYMKVAPDKF